MTNRNGLMIEKLIWYCWHGKTEMVQNMKVDMDIWLKNWFSGKSYLFLTQMAIHQLTTFKFIIYLFYYMLFTFWSVFSSLRITLYLQSCLRMSYPYTETSYQDWHNIQWNLHITDTIRTDFNVICREVSTVKRLYFNDYVNFGTQVSVRCMEVSV